MHGKFHRYHRPGADMSEMVLHTMPLPVQSQRLNDTIKFELTIAAGNTTNDPHLLYHLSQHLLTAPC